MAYRVGMLITGDEVIAGDIEDRNGYEIAKALSARGVVLGSRLQMADDLATLKHGLKFLLEHHECVVTTGGLGPTSDDLTRYAIAEVSGCDLVFHEPTWDFLIERAKSNGRALPDTNRQQAYFPSGAQLIENLNGTARGCELVLNDQRIIMLPGPPKEWRPMFERDVMPSLEAAGFFDRVYKLSWELETIGESLLQEKMNTLKLPDSCRIGYRYHPPYLELKVFSACKSDLQIAKSIIQPLIQVFLPH